MGLKDILDWMLEHPHTTVQLKNLGGDPKILMLKVSNDKVYGDCTFKFDVDVLPHIFREEDCLGDIVRHAFGERDDVPDSSGGCGPWLCDSHNR